MHRIEGRAAHRSWLCVVGGGPSPCGMHRRLRYPLMHVNAERRVTAQYITRSGEFVGALESLPLANAVMLGTSGLVGEFINGEYRRTAGPIDLLRGGRKWPSK